MSSSRINYTPTLSNRNVLINGNFMVWQRGTTGSNATSNATAYGPDRWVAYRGSYATGITWSRITPGYDSFMYGVRVARADSNAALDIMYLGQSIETINSYAFRGQTATLSFWARKGSGFSAASSILRTRLISGTGTDQTVTGTITGSANVIDQNITLTTSWQKFTVTGTVGSTATQLFVLLSYTPVGTASSDYFEVSGMQLELGSAATPFENRSYQQELALCQRYFVRFGGGSGGNTFGAVGSGYAGTGGTNTRIAVLLPVMLRAAPTPTVGGTVACGGSGVSASIASVAQTYWSPNSPTVFMDFNMNAGLAAGNSVVCYTTNATSGYFDLSAEL